MKDRLAPCIYYICCNCDCKKGFRNVNMNKCKNCSKYQPRKSNHKEESIKHKKEKILKKFSKNVDF